jgi:hypothetical protein
MTREEVITLVETYAPASNDELSFREGYMALGFSAPFATGLNRTQVMLALNNDDTKKAIEDYLLS